MPEPPASSTRPDRSQAAVAPGSRLRVHLAIDLEDGTEVLSSFDAEPFQLEIGDGTLAPGLEALLIGLTAGTDARFVTDGETLFGTRDPDNVHSLEPGDLPPGFIASPGQVIQFTTPGGQETAGTVLEVRDDGVRVDFNHPLSGRALRLRVRILSVA